ncbi:coenzyme F420-0:L-glutamate ligase [Actinoplanes sp. NPDC026670]|uniref:coenzyme F420-0:L-glutamate ligase n=1 Tax=Actinoplanes sp. NPDC026670 TaxID=3154700 RepID=UPI0033F9749F
MTGGTPDDGLQVLPVRGIGDVVAGDDLAHLIVTAAPWIADGDVLVVTSKIVSKAEGRLVEVPADGPEREEARQRVLDGETARVVARRGPTSIVQTHHGFVMAAAGIDASNVDKTHLVLLPQDPDASARRLRADLLARGLDVVIVVSDTMGRAWRNGLTDVALGAAGIEALLDHRGQVDPYGNELSLTQMAVVDELAAAAELVKGKCDRVPVAVVRGYPRSGEGSGAAVLIRDAESDMFSLGTAEAHAEGLRAAAALPDVPLASAAPTTPHPGVAPVAPQAGTAPTTPHPGVAPVAPQAGVAPVAPQAGVPAVAGPSPAAGARVVDPAAVARALRAVDGLRQSQVRLADGIRLTPAQDGAAALIRTGADAHRLRAALAAEGVETTAVIDDEGVTLTYRAPTAGVRIPGDGAETAGAPE